MEWKEPQSSGQKIIRHHRPVTKREDKVKVAVEYFGELGKKFYEVMMEEMEK